MSEDAENKSNSGRWIIAVVAALAVYALSYAPIFALAHKIGMSESRVNVISHFYAPLTWVAVNTSLGGPMASYCNWWCARFDVPVYFDYGDIRAQML